MRKYYSKCLLSIGRQTLLAISVLYFGIVEAQNVSVSATGGTATGSYTTVSAAFAAINAGTHYNDVTLTIVNNTTEPASPVSLQAPATTNGYTSVTIRPQGVRSIGLNSLSTNRSIIELFGAKNVTIDGDDPASTAIDRSLTIEFYSGTGAFNNTSVIRIGSVSTTNFAENILVKNCRIIGPRPASSSTAVNFGVVIGGSSTSNITATGDLNRNITIENNEITRCLVGIYSIATGFASLSSNFTKISIKKNLIGITSVANDMIGQYGVYFFCSSKSGNNDEAIIEQNQIRVGNAGIAMTTAGIMVVDGNPGTIVRYNTIRDINNPTTSTATNGTTGNVAGIFLFGSFSTNIDINNNIIRDVISARKTTTLGSSANYGIYLLDFGSVKLNHNTVGLITPNTVGTTANAASGGIYAMRTTTGPANLILEYNNNVIANNNASTNAVCFGFSTDSIILNTSMDKNCYHYPNGNGIYRGFTNTLYSLADWQVVTAREQNSFIEKPPFISNADLHMQASAITRIESNALPSGYVFDVDLDGRPNPTDIGADEFSGTPYVAPVLLNANHTPNTQSCAAVARTIQAIFSNLGNALDSVMVEYSVNGGAKTYLRMNQVSTLGFTRVISAVSPLNATVAYRVFAVTKVGDTVSSNYGYYNDNTASKALLPALSADPSQSCANSAVMLNYRFAPDPTGFIFPPTVTDTLTQVNITNVKLRNIDNTSPATNSLVGTLGTATGVKGAYSNFRNFSTDTFQLGKSYSVSVSGASTVNARLYFAAYIDFDGDGTFNGANERVFSTVQARTIGSRTEGFNLYIPPDVRPGKTCIRFICSHAPILTPYSTVFRGEIEDYSIYISQLAIVWKTGTTTIGANNPQSYTPTAIPATVYVELTDSSGCSQASNALNITASPSGMNVTMSAPSAACYNVPVLVRANVTGGCPPYTYAWSNGAPNTSTQLVTLANDTLHLTVTVTDKNGQQYSATGRIDPNNPRLTSVPDTVIICNRGSRDITVSTASTDSAYWYTSATDLPFDEVYVGKTYTTPVLNSTKDFYVAAVRSYADSVGKMNTTGTNVTNNYVPLSGLQFDAQEPVIIRDCWMYLTGITGASVNIGLLDKYGTLLTQTNYTISSLPASIATPTRIPLNFEIATPDTAYRLVLLGINNLTALMRHTSSSGYSYPFMPLTKPLIIRKAYSIPNPTSTDYFYFYNIRVMKGVCVGQKDTTTAKVTPPRVPQVLEDLKYTLLCKDDTLKLKILTDTLGNRFVWSKNGSVIQNASVTPLSDTFYTNEYLVPISSPSDTGLYQVRIFSSEFCTRDTFSREVRVSFHKEPKFITNLKKLDMCITKNATLSVVVNDASTYRWYKDTLTQVGLTSIPQYDITNPTAIDTGYYHVTATDSNNCRTVSSDTVRVIVHDTIKIVAHPIDTVVCEGDRYVINTTVQNGVTYSWFKDNGILTGFIQPKLTLYSANVSDSGSYRLVINSYPGCPEAITNIAKIVVNPKPEILGFYPSEFKFCQGQKIKLVSQTKNKTRVDWYKNGVVVGNLDSFVKSVSVLTDSGKYYFKLIALNKCANLSSDTMNVKVFNKPTVSGTRPNFISCEGADFKVGFNSTFGNINQWYKDGVPIQSQTDSQLWLQFVTAKDNGTYHVKVNSDPVCPEVTSSSFTVDIKTAPKIILQPKSSTACMGEDVVLTAGAQNQTGYQWYKDGSVVPAATTNTLTILNLAGTNAGKYWVVASATSPCLPVTSDTVTVIHRSGQTNAVLSLVSVYNTEEQCTDASGWTYYATKEYPDKYLFAAKKNGNSMVGAADIVIRPSTFQSVINTGTQYSATLMLKRFWNYKLISGQMTNPIDVKFYVAKSELDELDSRKADIQNLYGNDLTLVNETKNWFKSKDFAFTNSLLGGIRGGQFNFDSIVFEDIVEGEENGIKYFQFINLANIGGGTAYYSFKGKGRYLSITNSNATIAASISPNPNQGEFNLDIVSKSLGKVDIVVVNAIGQTVYNEQLRLNSLVSENRMSIPNLANGIYQLILTKDDVTTSLKLQIDK